VKTIARFRFEIIQKTKVVEMEIWERFKNKQPNEGWEGVIQRYETKIEQLKVKFLNGKWKIRSLEYTPNEGDIWLAIKNKD
jgi:hypothetical protein